MSHDNEKSFYKPSLYVAFAMLAFFSLVSCSSEDSAESGQASGEIEKRTAPIGQVDVATAGDTSEESMPVAEAGPGKSTYDSVCFACHAQGIAGAPKQGDKAAWAARLDQGNDVLYDHAINGFTGSGGMMPAKGGRADISDDDVKAAVDYMLEAVGVGTTAAAMTEEAPAATQETEIAAASLEAAGGGKGKEVYDSTCFVCHTTGVAGAPKFGDKEDWAARAAQGNDTLYDHAINGFMGQGMMPPKGGKADLSDDDVKAAVDYMIESGS